MRDDIDTQLDRLEPMMRLTPRQRWLYGAFLRSLTLGQRLIVQDLGSFIPETALEAAATPKQGN